MGSILAHEKTHTSSILGRQRCALVEQRLAFGPQRCEPGGSRSRLSRQPDLITVAPKLEQIAKLRRRVPFNN